MYHIVKVSIQLIYCDTIKALWWWKITLKANLFTCIHMETFCQCCCIHINEHPEANIIDKVHLVGLKNFKLFIV